MHGRQEMKNTQEITERGDMQDNSSKLLNKIKKMAGGRTKLQGVL
jgi:hypothetical protein